MVLTPHPLTKDIAMNSLDQLKKLCRLVADTADISAIEHFQPEEVTTNPTLVRAAVEANQLPRGSLNMDSTSSLLNEANVLLGVRLLHSVPGRVSTEVDARLSFNTPGTIEAARHIVRCYERHGQSREKILVKIAATWEGIEAARILEQEGIHCNMTLIFSLVQALACAQVGATLISPFVGRIYDWHLKKESLAHFQAEHDPGIRAVKEIQKHFRLHGYATQIMAASFRTTEQVKALSDCELLTISPGLLSDLESEYETVQPLILQLLPDHREIPDPMTEKHFRWWMNEDEAATVLLADGIRRFARDIEALEQWFSEA